MIRGCMCPVSSSLATTGEVAALSRMEQLVNVGGEPLLVVRTSTAGSDARSAMAKHEAHRRI